MARHQGYAGFAFETRSIPTVELDTPPDALAGIGTTTPIIDTTIYRSGSASAKCVGTAANTSYLFRGVAPAAGTSLFLCFPFRLSALPSATKKIARFGTTAYGSVRLTSAGKLQLWNDTGTPAQIGSDSALTVVADTWYVVFLKQTIGVGAVDALELRVKQDGPDSIYPIETVASGASLSLSDTQPVRFEVGIIEAFAATMYVDDVVLNDSTGTRETSWPRGEKLVLKLPISATGPASYTACNNSTVGTVMADGLDNRPPIGIADHNDSSHTTIHHVNHSGGIAGEALTLTFNSYGRDGIAGNVAQEDTAHTTQYAAVNTTGFERKYAQSFMASGTLGSVALYMTKINPNASFPFNETLELRSDSSGLPSNTVLATITKSSLDIPVGPGWVTWDLPDYPLVAGTTYWLVLSSTRTSSSNEVRWYMRASGATDYPDGRNASQSGTDAWALGTPSPTVHNDFAFRMFVSTGVSPITVVQPLVCHGEGVSTGTKDGSLEMDLNPVVSSAAFTYGDNAGACGTYPGNFWRWAKAGPGYEPPITNMGLAPRALLKRTDGTSRIDLACSFVIIVGYLPAPPPAWMQVTRTSDSSLHWVKQAPNTMTMAKSDESEVECVSGDWFIQPNPLPSEGSPATLSTITTATLQADYTGW